MSNTKYDTHTVTLTASGRDITFSIAELYEMRERQFDLILEAETNKRHSQLAEFDPTSRGLEPVNDPRSKGLVPNVDYFYDPDGFGQYPYGMPLLAFGAPPAPSHVAYVRRRGGGHTPVENRWFITLSGNTQTAFSVTDWDDREGFDRVVTRLATTTAELLAAEAALTGNVHWDDRHDCPWEEINDLLEEIPHHDPVDTATISGNLNALHVTSGGVHIIDPYTLRHVELPQLFSVEVPTGTRVSEVDKLIRAQGLAPIRATGKRTRFSGSPNMRLAAHASLAKQIPSLDKRVIYWMCNTVKNTNTGMWERRTSPVGDRRPHINPETMTLQQRNAALAD